jgi:hypothetical protein
LGGELHLTLNALDLLPPEAQAKGALKDRAEILQHNLALDPALRSLPE